MYIYIYIHTYVYTCPFRRPEITLRDARPAPFGSSNIWLERVDRCITIIQ